MMENMNAMVEQMNDLAIESTDALTPVLKNDHNFAKGVVVGGGGLALGYVVIKKLVIPGINKLRCKNVERKQKKVKKQKDKNNANGVPLEEMEIDDIEREYPVD